MADELGSVKNLMSKSGFEVIDDGGGEYFEKLPTSTVEIDEDQLEQFSDMMDELEQIEDVQNVIHNLSVRSKDR